MSELVIFWKARPDAQLAPAAVARDLLWGEDVEGLIDLPVKEILDRLKAEFPQHLEKPGFLTLHLAADKCEITWSWQHVQVEVTNASAEERQRIEKVLGEFGCQWFAATR